VTQHDSSAPATASQRAYLDAAEKLRSVAAQPTSIEARLDLLRLAALYEKLAEHSARHTDSSPMVPKPLDHNL
jgi:hypothetical protein